MLVFLLVGFFFIALLGPPWVHPDPPTPLLLQDVSARGGWWGACPAKNDVEAKSHPHLAISPELNQRLGEQFPPGSDEAKIIDTLKKQGFALPRPCDGDDSIRSAMFNQQGGSLFASPLSAEVFWKVDGAGNILWTKGFVRYIGL
jgi:hypothetical protein